MIKKEALVNSTLNAVETFAAVGIGLTIGLGLAIAGKEARDQFGTSIANDALSSGTAPRVSRLPLMFYPKADRMQIRKDIDESLAHYWRRQAREAQRRAA